MPGFVKKIGQFINSKQNGVILAASVIVAILLFTKLLGLVKTRLMAYYFGTSADLDTFYAANAVPDALFYAITAGTFSSSIIPLLAKRNEKSKEKFHETINRLLIFFGLAFAVLSLLTMIFSPLITDLYLRFSDNEQLYDRNLMTLMSIILSVVPLLLSLSTILTAGLQVKKRFFISSLSMPLHTIGLIIGMVLLANVIKPSILSLALGTVLGSFLHLAIQLPGMYAIKHQFRAVRNILNDDIVYIFKQSTPRVLSLAGEYLTKLQATQISLMIGEGALSAYQYALQLYLIPSTLIGYSLSQAMFPNLSKFSNSKDYVHFGRYLRQAIGAITLLTTPVAAIVLVTRFDLVRIFLSTGKFDWNSILATSWVFAMLSVGIVMQALLSVLLRAYYAIDDTKTPFVVLVFASIVNVVGNIYLTTFFSNYRGLDRFISEYRFYSWEESAQSLQRISLWFTQRGESMAAAGGLGLAISLSLTIQVVTLYFLLNRRIKFHTANFTRSINNKWIGFVFSVIGMFVVKRYLETRLDLSYTFQTILYLAIETLIGSCIYGLVLLILQDSTLNNAMRMAGKYVARIRDR